MDIQVLLVHLTMVPMSLKMCKVNMDAQYYTVMLETFLQNALHPPQLDLL